MKKINVEQILESYNRKTFTPLYETDPRLSGNIALSIISEDEFYFDSIPSNPQLAQSKFIKVPLTYNDYALDIAYFARHMSKGGKTEPFFEKNKNTPYYIRSIPLESDVYSQNSIVFSPLFLGNVSFNHFPTHFGIFEIDRSLYTSFTGSVNAYNFQIQRFLEQNETTHVRSIHLKSGKLGHYIKNILDYNNSIKDWIRILSGNIPYNEGLDFQLETIEYNGIDILSGTLTKRTLLLDRRVHLSNETDLDWKNYVYYNRNKSNLIDTRFLNLQFLNDYSIDPTSNKIITGFYYHSDESIENKTRNYFFLSFGELDIQSSNQVSTIPISNESFLSLEKETVFIEDQDYSFPIKKVEDDEESFEYLSSLSSLDIKEGIRIIVDASIERISKGSLLIDGIPFSKINSFLITEDSIDIETIQYYKKGIWIKNPTTGEFIPDYKYNTFSKNTLIKTLYGEKNQGKIYQVIHQNEENLFTISLNDALFVQPDGINYSYFSIEDKFSTHKKILDFKKGQNDTFFITIPTNKTDLFYYAGPIQDTDRYSIKSILKERNINDFISFSYSLIKLGDRFSIIQNNNSNTRKKYTVVSTNDSTVQYQPYVYTSQECLLSSNNVIAEYGTDSITILRARLNFIKDIQNIEIGTEWFLARRTEQETNKSYSNQVKLLLEEIKKVQIAKDDYYYELIFLDYEGILNNEINYSYAEFFMSSYQETRCDFYVGEDIDIDYGINLIRALNSFNLSLSFFKIDNSIIIINNQSKNPIKRKSIWSFEINTINSYNNLFEYKWGSSVPASSVYSSLFVSTDQPFYSINRSLQEFINPLKNSGKSKIIVSKFSDIQDQISFEFTQHWYTAKKIACKETKEVFETEQIDLYSRKPLEFQMLFSQAEYFINKKYTLQIIVNNDLYNEEFIVTEITQSYVTFQRILNNTLLIEHDDVVRTNLGMNKLFQMNIQGVNKHYYPCIEIINDSIDANLYNNHYMIFTEDENVSIIPDYDKTIPVYKNARLKLAGITINTIKQFEL